MELGYTIQRSDERNLTALSPRYIRTFELFRELRARGLCLSLESPLEIPQVIARNYLVEKFNALRLSKMGVAVNYVFQVKSAPPPLPTIHMYGPDLLGEKEAVISSPYFLSPFGMSWKNGGSSSLGYGYVIFNTARIQELKSRYPFDDNVHAVARAMSNLSTEEDVRIAYDLSFCREKPTGSIKTVGAEAFSDVVGNTLRRNFARAQRLGLMKKAAGVEDPIGEVEISCVENDLEGSTFDSDCLKIGPSNNLLTFRTIWLLNCTGFRPYDTSVGYLTASRYLWLTMQLQRARHQARSSLEARQPMTETIRKLESERAKLEYFVLRNVRRSTLSLLKDAAIEKTPMGYLVKGNSPRTPCGTFHLDSFIERDENARIFEIINKTHRLTLQIRGEADN